MSSAPASQPAPDLRRAVRRTAALSMALLGASGLTGLFASGGGTASAVHSLAVVFALPVSLVAHLIALVACRPPDPPSPRSTGDPVP